MSQNLVTTVLAWLAHLSAIVGIISFILSLRETRRQKKMIATFFVHEARHLVNQIDTIKRASSDTNAKGQLELVQGNVERLRNCFIDIFDVEAEKNGP